jgi:hypothetical protein
MTTKELLTIKEYLWENLYKGFIMLNSIFFVSSVLFVVKFNNSLCFCINYYKLNNLIKKDQYLLFLINKTLA